MNAVGHVVIVDMTVFLNLLNVPKHRDNRDDVYRDFERFLNAGATLMLPLATVFETAGHIADVRNGGNRRRYAEVFCETVTEVLNEKAPWRLVSPPNTGQLAKWLESFPDCAMRRISLSDVSQIELWKAQCKQLFGTRVSIWSLDKHLRGYDRIP